MPPPRVDEDYSAGPEVNEPVRERSNRHGSESSTLEVDVYVWRYALIVVQASNERTNEHHWLFIFSKPLILYLLSPFLNTKQLNIVMLCVCVCYSSRHFTSSLYYYN